jgi:RNA polymerase sigma-70 factor (ECF subfamily)
MTEYQESKFPETRWHRVRDAHNSERPEEARRAFEELCRDYWRPLYAYLRTTGLNSEDASRYVNELFYRMTYELFPIHHPGDQLPEIPAGQMPIGKQRKGRDAHLLQRAEEFGAVVRPDLSEQAPRLRQFFMLQLKTITHTDRRSASRKSADGGMFSAEDVTRFENELRDDHRGRLTSDTPDEVFRRCWRRTVLLRSREALEKAMRERGDGRRFEVLWPLVEKDGEESASAAAAGETLGMTEGAVRNALFQMRKKFRDQILLQIADTVASDDPAVLEEEVQALFF